MKIRIETDPSITEDEVIIRCGKISDSILKMEHALNDLCISDTNFIFYKGDTEFYLPLDSILFFETEDNQVFAHTKKDVYRQNIACMNWRNCFPVLLSGYPNRRY